MQQKYFTINDYFIGDKFIEVDVMPNKFVDEHIEIDNFDFLAFMQTHGYLDGLGNPSLDDIQRFTNIEILPIIERYILIRLMDSKKLDEHHTALINHFRELFKHFEP